MTDICTDYLIVGGGAVGLAFADTLLAETDAHITIVDRYGKPGGHWNDAYSFVALHQPSSFYGVSSMPLGSGQKDSVGINAGLYELASGPEVSGYFDAVMRQKLLPSRRVAYFPMTNYIGEGRCVSVLSGIETRVAARKKTVDATYYRTAVPSTHTPRYKIGSGVNLVPPNALPQMALKRMAPPGRYVIVGAGKTAMDVAVWLLGCGVPAEDVTWVMPRDSWLLNRLHTQPGTEFFAESIGGLATQMEAFAKATSVDDLFARLEVGGIVLRLDPNVRPDMMHYATVSVGEVSVLREIGDIIRKGRVVSIQRDGLYFDAGHVPIAPDALYIDCTASAVERRPPVPIFQGDKIVLQLVRAPQPAFSASLVAHVEAHYCDELVKNELCATVSLPDTVEQFPGTALANMTNEANWSKEPTLRGWINRNRLDGFGKIIAVVGKQDVEKQAILAKMREYLTPAASNLRRLAARYSG